ncbi:unnamed protein product [Oncorhynchus mykiss]|uniref:Uncharacterized protein n=1 Tax=Oncorhynchus mykiss TaxID=8022 RepID=A0A060X4P7_ONCMY|nr:unnamed protein product [Oncorhynchus mykiss]
MCVWGGSGASVSLLRPEWFLRTVKIDLGDTWALFYSLRCNMAPRSSRTKYISAVRTLSRVTGSCGVLSPNRSSTG